MTRIACTLLAAAALAASPLASAACSYPAEVDIPDGRTASEAQMKAANAAVKEYNARVEEYLACMDDEEKALGDAVTEEQKKVHTAKHNAAVDALNAVVARYNEQVQAFKKAKDR